VQITIPF